MFTLPLLFGLVVSKPAFVGLAAAAAGLGGYLLVRGDSRVEGRRRNAVQLSRIASENGLPLTSQMLDAYAVGDYSGVIAGVSNLHQTLTDEKQRKAAVHVFLETQLDLRLASPEQTDGLLGLIEQKKPGLLATWLDKKAKAAAAATKPTP